MPDFQSLSKKESYIFDKKTLSFKQKKRNYRTGILKILKIWGISTLLALLFSGFFYLVWGSPIEHILNSEVLQYKTEFAHLNSKIDSLQNDLHRNYYAHDKNYRILLELDSLPNPLRLAGTGGSEQKEWLDGLDYYKLIKTTKKRLNTLNRQLQIQDTSYSTIFNKATIYNAKLDYIPAIPPVNPTSHIRITSYFGSRTDPFTHFSRMHEGIDFAGPKNTDIFATADGIVSKTKNSIIGYGKEIIISHKFGYSTRYAHLNKILVQEGDTIQRGQLIGLMGSTGRSTGTHLHYEVRINRRPINPAFFYSDELNAEEYELMTQRSAK